MSETQRNKNGVRTRRDTTKEHHDVNPLVRTPSSGSRTSNSSSHTSTASRTSSSSSTSTRSNHSTSQRRSESESFYDESSSLMTASQSMSNRSRPEAPSRISSGNRFYADVIAKQQKEHAIKRQAAQDTRSASKQSTPITRTPSAAVSKRVVTNTTNSITHTSSLAFAASFFQPALYQTPSSTESVA